MVQPTPLHYVNGGAPQIPTCTGCGVQLHDPTDRCSSKGRFFCKADPEHPLDSCYLQWRQRHN